MNTSRLIFIHGLESSGQGTKAKLLRKKFPGMLTPDFPGGLNERMKILDSILREKTGWTIIGSSFGGLMGALFTCSNPGLVRKLVLLAPALVWPDFAQNPPGQVNVPTVIYHGRQDDLLPLETVRQLAQRAFTNLMFHAVDDDHRLLQTVQNIDWVSLLE
jgi:pimeloyl-ACP methyl ester carboxylesterase